MTNKGARFEHSAAKVFQQNGYKNVQVTRATGDGGIDIAMVKDGKRYAVECKCFKKDLLVGRPIVQKLNTAMLYPTEYKNSFKYGIIVTTSGFSKQAKEYVDQINKSEGYERIRLIDGVEYKEMANRVTFLQKIMSKISWKVKLLFIASVTVGIIVYEGWTTELLNWISTVITQYRGGI